MRVRRTDTETDDRQIVRQTLSGDTQAFGLLVKRYLAVVHGLVYLRIGNHADAEDITQEVFVAAYRSLDTLRDPHKFPAWLTSIARNMCSGLKRSRARELEVTRAAQPDRVAVHTEDMAARELYTMLHVQLGQMDETAQEVLVLHYFAGKTTREIAEILGISNHAAKKRLERARDALGRNMAASLGPAFEPPVPPAQRLERIMGVIALETVPWRNAAPDSTHQRLRTRPHVGGDKLLISNLKAAIIAISCVTVGILLWKISGPTVAKPPARELAQTPQTETLAQAKQISNPPFTNREFVEHNLNPSAAALLRALAGRDAGSVKTASAKYTQVEQSYPTGPARVLGFVLTKGTRRPISGAKVVITMAPKRNHLQAVRSYEPLESDSPHWEVWSNADGEYKAEHLPYSSYTLVASNEDASATRFSAATEFDPENTTDFELQPTGAISGCVRDDAGRPIANAQLVPQESDSNRKPAVSSDDITHLPTNLPGDGVIAEACRAFSGPDGTFQMSNLPQAKWKIAVKARGYAAVLTDFIPSGAIGVEITLTRGGAVSGHVLSANSGDPLSGVQVVLKSDAISMDRLATKSNADGRFEFFDLADGGYALTIEDEKLVAISAATHFNIQSANSVEGVEITATEGGSVTGRVFYADTDVPVGGVVIRASSTETGPVRRVRSGTNGVYRINGLRAGYYQLDRRYNTALQNQGDLPPTPVSVALGEQVTGVDFPVKPGLAVRAKVVDTAGRPVDHAIVTAIQNGPNGTDGTEPSREDGTTTIYGFPPHAEIVITARKGPLSAGTVGPLSFGDDDMDGVEIVMEKSASIAGTVVNKSGVPLDRVYVIAESEGVSESSIGGGGAGTDSSGQFKIEGLQAGTYAISMRQSDTYRSSESHADPVQLTKGQDLTGVCLVMDEEEMGLTIAGRVTTKQGSPIKDARIEAYVTETGESKGGTNSDASGFFVIHGLEDGMHRVSAYHRSFSQPSPIDVAAGSANVNFVMEGRGAVEGKVVDAGTGNPIKLFQVAQFKGTGLKLEQWMQRNLITYSNPDGKFRLENAEVGDSTILAQAKGYTPALATAFGITERGTVSGAILRLEPGACVKGVVRDTSGQPIGGAQVFLDPQSLDTLYYNAPGVAAVAAAATTDRNGEFTLDSLAAHDITIRVVHSDYVQTSFSVTPSLGQVSPIEFVLSPGGTVSGTIRVGGKPIAGAYVNVFSTESHSSGKTDASGVYTISKLPKGTVRVDVVVRGSQMTQQGDRNMTQTAEVATGKVTVVDFNSTDGNASIEGTITVSGQAPKRAYLTASTVDHSGANRDGISAQTDSSGHYRVDGLSSGLAQVVVIVENHSGASRQRMFTAQTVAGEVIHKDIEMNEGVTVSGALAGVGQGEAGFVIALRGEVSVGELGISFIAANQDKLVAQAQAQNGLYTITNLDPGHYTLVALSLKATGAPFSSKARQTTASIDVGNEPLTLDLTIP